MKQVLFFISLLITSCVGSKEHSWSSASASSAMVENDTVEPEVVIPEELDEFVVASQGGSGAYVKDSPSFDTPTIMTYPDGTTFTGAYTDVPRWIMVVENGCIIGYIHDENVSQNYGDYEGDYYNNECVEYYEEQTTRECSQSDMNSSTTVVVGKTTQNKDLRILDRLKELDRKSRELLWDLQRMQRMQEEGGKMDSQRFIEIKNTVLNNIDEQIQLAEELGDNELVLKYQQQRQRVMQAY